MQNTIFKQHTWGFFSPNNFAHFFMVSAKIYIFLNTKEKKTNKSQKCEIITDMKESYVMVAQSIHTKHKNKSGFRPTVYFEKYH